MTVQYATADGTATADAAHADGADYTAPASNATLTITAGKTSETISVATGDDTADEDDESFTVTLSSPSSNAELGTKKTATGTIEDDDTDPAVVTNVAFTNRPSNNVYGLGDVIEVSVTFDIAVEVGGTPRVNLNFVDAHRLDEYADYDASLQHGQGARLQARRDRQRRQRFQRPGSDERSPAQRRNHPEQGNDRRRPPRPCAR